MQEANSDTKFQKGQQDADFFKKLHKVICVSCLRSNRVQLRCMLIACHELICLFFPRQAGQSEHSSCVPVRQVSMVHVIAV